MNDHAAYIKLYGAYGAAMDEIDHLNFGRCRAILKQAIEDAEELMLADDGEGSASEP